MLFEYYPDKETEFFPLDSLKSKGYKVYDASKDALIENWSTAAYNDASWKPVKEVPLEGTGYNATSTDFSGRKTSIAYDDFRLVEGEYCLAGRRSGRQFRMGDKITIKVVAANLVKRQLDYEWVIKPNNVEEEEHTEKMKKKNTDKHK